MKKFYLLIALLIICSGVLSLGGCYRHEKRSYHFDPGYTFNSKTDSYCNK